MPRTRPAALALALSLLAAAPLAAQDKDKGKDKGDEKVYRLLSAEQLEGMLKKFKVEHKKGAADVKGIHFFDLSRDPYKVRLTSFEGKDLMLDCPFKPIPLERVNAWNVAAKFSRATLQKDSTGEFVTLEFNLDVVGGVTEGTVKQFITQFDLELKAFDRFVSGLVGDGKLLPGAGDAVIEKVLGDLSLKFEKKGDGKGLFVYDFELNAFKVRLYNFGGQDLMADAKFRKMDLDKINQYNLDRKFVRAVAYNRNGMEYTSLECNLDCSAGVTEEMIRHFIVAFGEDVKHFATFVQRKK